MPKAPSPKQTAYLKRLGYRGEPPNTSQEASAAIEEMLDSDNWRKAETAILRERDERKRREKQRRRDDLAAAKSQIRFMLRENKSYGGEGLYAGFLFVEVEDEEPSQHDALYVGAFLPLNVAADYPELLTLETVEAEELMVDDKIPAGARTVTEPGRFDKGPRRRRQRAAHLPLWISLVAIAVASGVVVALMLL